MKLTIKTFFSFLLAMFIVSCSNDEVTNAELEGIWLLTSLSIESSFDFNNNGTSSNDLVNEVTCYSDDYLEFNADGTVQIVNGFTQVSIDIVSSTEYNYVHQCFAGLNDYTTWIQDGASVTVENGSNDLLGFIDGNELILIIENGFTVPVYDGADISNTQETMRLVYVRQ